MPSNSLMSNNLTIYRYIFLLTIALFISPDNGCCIDVTADSLSFSDVNKAVDQVKASGGGTVYLPEGISELWTQTLQLHGGINLIGKGPLKTVIRWNYDNKIGVGINQASPRIYTTFRISGIKFIGTFDPDDSNTNDGNSIYSLISMRSCPGFRIDHCVFEGGRYVIGVGNEIGQPPSTGVIDNCKIFRGDVSHYAPVYGVSVGAREYIDDKALGTADAVVIEDCILEDLGHPVGAFGGSHYVLRHSEIRYRKNKASFPIDAHGPGFTKFDGKSRGARAWEIYNNTIVGNPGKAPLGWRAIGLRAGKGVIFNNHIQNFRYAVSFYCDPATCNSNGRDAVNDAYIWGNSLTNVVEEEVLVQDDPCTRTYVKEGKSFFLTSAPNYTPLRYPHPLRTDKTDTPAAPSSLTIIP